VFNNQLLARPSLPIRKGRVGHSGSLLPHFIKLSLSLKREDFVDFSLQAGLRDDKWLQDAGLLRRELAHLTKYRTALSKWSR